MYVTELILLDNITSYSPRQIYVYTPSLLWYGNQEAQRKTPTPPLLLVISHLANAFLYKS